MVSSMHTHVCRVTAHSHWLMWFDSIWGWRSHDGKRRHCGGLWTAPHEKQFRRQLKIETFFLHWNKRLNLQSNSYNTSFFSGIWTIATNRKSLQRQCISSEPNGHVTVLKGFSHHFITIKWNLLVQEKQRLPVEQHRTKIKPFWTGRGAWQENKY